LFRFPLLFGETDGEYSGLGDMPGAGVVPGSELPVCAYAPAIAADKKNASVIILIFIRVMS
jgi:hypothetical protein